MRIQCPLVSVSGLPLVWRYNYDAITMHQLSMIIVQQVGRNDKANLTELPYMRHRQVLRQLRKLQRSEFCLAKNIGPIVNINAYRIHAFTWVQKHSDIISDPKLFTFRAELTPENDVKCFWLAWFRVNRKKAIRYEKRSKTIWIHHRVNVS